MSYPVVYKWHTPAIAADDVQAIIRRVSRGIAALESDMLRHEQADCPVIHRFGKGLYIREVHIKAGTLAIGHIQKFEHNNLFLRGRVLMIGEDGSTKELAAPMQFVGEPGRKVGLILEDMVWQNIYATDETDIETLEATYLDKSAAWLASIAQRRALEVMRHAEDRSDFDAVLAESGFGAETVRTQSESEADRIDVSGCVKVAESPIEGRGLFATAPFDAGDVILPARIDGMRTQAGRFTNHSATPNAQMRSLGNGDIVLVATRRIEGCKGGQDGDEITIDYRQALALSGVVCRKKGEVCLG